MHDALACIPPKPTYEQLRELEARLLQCEQMEPELTHHFADGVYGRELFIPKGATLVGKIHKHSTLNILLRGKIAVTNADGAVRVLEGPAVFVSPPGCKKVGHALEDTVWMNVHGTKLTDLAAIEAKFIVPEEKHAITEEKKCLGQP